METFHTFKDKALRRYETSVQAAAEESWTLHPASSEMPRQRLIKL